MFTEKFTERFTEKFTERFTERFTENYQRNYHGNYYRNYHGNPEAIFSNNNQHNQKNQSSDNWVMSEWEEKTLGELVEVDPEQLASDTEADYSFFYIDISSVSLGSINYPIHPINYTGSPSRARKVLRVNDILMSSVRPNLKAFAQFKRDSKLNFIASTGFSVLRAKSNTVIDFVYHSLLSNEIEKQIEALVVGSNYPAINSSDVRKLKIKTPPVAEQRQIAKILSTADAVIEKTQAAIAKYKAIKQGMLHDLFTRGIDIATGKLRPSYTDAPELYKESKLGWIPEEWEVDFLGNLAEKIGSGVTPTGGSEIYKSSGVLFLRSQNVLIGKLSIADAAFITKEIDERMEYSRVKPFDVLLNITGASIGRCAFFPSELKTANVNQHVCIIRFKNNSKPLAVLVSEFLNSDFGQAQIYKSIAGGNREGLNFQQIKSFLFPVIEITEMRKISMVLDNLNNKLQSEQTYLHKLQKIKMGLMNDLLSGKKPVQAQYFAPR